MGKKDKSEKKNFPFVLFTVLFVVLIAVLAVTAAVAFHIITPGKGDEPAVDEHWEMGKCSGSEEDFNKYFAVATQDYEQKLEDKDLGTIESITYTYKKKEGEAYVYLPPDYSADKEYPVLYMLHGLGGDRRQWIDCHANTIISTMILKGEVCPLIAVFPTIENYDGVEKKYIQEFENALEPYILENYPVSRERKDTGICGMSAGGLIALHLGFFLKDHFNYIGAFAPPESDQFSYNELFDLEGWSFPPELVLLCCGSNDRTVGDTPYSFHLIFVNKQVDHIWYLYPSAGHTTLVWRTGLINFLKRSYK